MACVFFITHPDVEIDPAIPVPDWRLNARGISRMHAMLDRAWVGGITSIASSAERKAIDSAEILAGRLDVIPSIYPALGENDRSATGYLPKAAFEAAADAFFADPAVSVSGWERAIDAQARIVAATRSVVVAAPSGDIAVISHGGVGALLLCHIRGIPISRAADQPPGSGGYMLAFDRADLSLRHSWQLIDG